MLLHDGQSRGAPRAGGRGPEERRRGVEIVAHRQRRPEPVLYPHERRQGNRNPLGVGDGDPLNRLVDILPMGPFGLDVDLP